MDKDIDAVLSNAISDLMQGIMVGHDMRPEDLRATMLDLALVLKDLSDRVDLHNPT